MDIVAQARYAGMGEDDAFYYVQELRRLEQAIREDERKKLSGPQRAWLFTNLQSSHQEVSTDPDDPSYPRSLWSREPLYAPRYAPTEKVNVIKLGGVPALSGVTRSEFGGMLKLGDVPPRGTDHLVWLARGDLGTYIWQNDVWVLYTKEEL